MAIGKKIFQLIILISISILNWNCSSPEIKSNSVKTGADILLSEKFDIIKNKSIGIVTNHTAILSNGVHLVDTLYHRTDVKIIRLFGPEHGIRGDAPDGQSINDSVDVKTGLPVQSLYGKIRKPTPPMLKNIDVLLFDIQDVGARFYTFISTMFYTIQAASENNIPIIILDRPNPIGGIKVDGPVLDTNYISFVGITKLPIQHGMTVGELAKYFNQPKILRSEKPADLIVVKMKNWKREYYFNDCNLKWIKPSPNMPDLETAIVYPGLCLIEGTNISEGRGTYSPFLLSGSPFINSEAVISEMQNYNLDGVLLKASTFTPEEIPHMASSPKYENELCNGIFVKVTKRKVFKPVEFAIKIIYTFHKLYPEKFKFRESAIDRLWGSSELRLDIESGKSPHDIILSYKNGLNNFKEVRKKYLLY